MGDKTEIELLIEEILKAAQASQLSEEQVQAFSARVIAIMNKWHEEKKNHAETIDLMACRNAALFEGLDGVGTVLELLGHKHPAMKDGCMKIINKTIDRLAMLQ